MLNHVPFDGWSWEALYRGSMDLKLYKKELTPDDKDKLRSYFDYDLVKSVEIFNDYLDKEMKIKFSRQDQNKKRIPEKIKSLILLRLKSSSMFKESIRSSIAFMTLPQNSKKSFKMLYKTCDEIWRVAGDDSTNFSFYTKRLILAGVYTSTLMFWMNENSEKLIATEKFLDRRLNDISKFGKFKKLKFFFKENFNNNQSIMEMFLNNFKKGTITNFFNKH